MILCYYSIIVAFQGAIMSKVMSDKYKQTDRTTSIRLSPIAYAQLDELQNQMGESASRVMMRALDMLFNRYLDETDMRVPLRKIINRMKKDA